MNRSVTPDDADKTGKLVESFIVHRGFYDEVVDGIYSNPKIGEYRPVPTCRSEKSYRA
jgi:hypothetical protein